MTLKNTENNATIKVVSSQESDGLSDKIEFISEGGFYEKNGKFYITYKEHRDMGMGDSRVVLKVEQDAVTMRRMGDFRTIMVYKCGEITDFNYRTPFGEMSIKIKTEEAENGLSESGGLLRLTYLLFAGGAVTRNEVTIRVKMENGKDMGVK